MQSKSCGKNSDLFHFLQKKKKLLNERRSRAAKAPNTGRHATNSESELKKKRREGKIVGAASGDSVVTCVSRVGGAPFPATWGLGFSRP